MEYPKEVLYECYCKNCKHWKKKESDDPCDACLNIPFRGNSHKPVYFEPTQSSTLDGNKKKSEEQTNGKSVSM